ncbi:hypothetical protein C8A01DRAFT_14989 [Parachaetomium inaequale]|uniref:Zn(2)-C6 fungal-type domain-containing protein n=1 Tax=Parachaetomium inaequale TaxID=2588326 RepID=A0AAN6PJR1_9PEZI|nr:hypothetical protein C8A01DRAFT_14989 [Parachaetomium inaequale]
MEAEHPPLRHEGGDSHGQAGLLSCAQCRSRKLKCDRKRPICGRCVKQNETCSYPGLRQRALGRRKTVRDLEERIALSVDPGVPGLLRQPANQLIDLGIFEQLPSWDVIDQLTALYFQNIHAGAPTLHQATYTAALRLPPHMRPPMCLQYIVMASAAATSETYRHLSEPFYQRARVYAEADELKGPGETLTTVGHAQSWCLISAYECHVYAIFTRASTSLCRGVRIAQMLKLHQLDVQAPEPLPSALPPPRNWIEAEERRQTWWVVFLADRFLTSTTGWPSLVDERHIKTNLPSSEESFTAGIANDPPILLSNGLQELEQGRGAQLSPLAIRILAVNELLHALDHSANHSTASGTDDTQNGLYWRRHREIDTNLTTLTLLLPERLHLARNPRSLDAILIHICTNMATIQLHRTALALLRRGTPVNHLNNDTMIAQSEARLLPAAAGVLAVFRAAGDDGVGTAIRNPLLSFAAYMAASVFLEDCSRVSLVGPGGQDRSGRRRQSEESLDYLARILVFFGRSSSLVRANAFQLAADMKRSGYDASMMDKVLDQVGTLGGATSEIRVSGSKPMLFCPALTQTSTAGPAEGSTFGLQGASDSWGHGGGNLGFDAPFHGNSVAGPSGTGRGVALSMLQYGAPEGLFLQLGANPESFLL